MTAGPSSSSSRSISSSSSTKRSSLRRRRRRRKPPFPNSVLDRKALLEALDEYGLSVKQKHIDGFYQALHRQHYPDLPDFVKNYYFHDENIGKNKRELLSSSNNNSDEHEQQPIKLPLKNAISARKNRNRVQLPRAFLDFLKDSPSKNGLVTLTSTVAQQTTSNDGSTTKLAIQLHDGQLVESVLMRYISSTSSSSQQDGGSGRGGGGGGGGGSSSRASLCVSSQCGCAMGCTFCATGTMGLSGNLTTGEILEQIVHADRLLAQDWTERQRQQQQKENDNSSEQEKKGLDLVRNVVFMGMGEPLDNYKNVVEACRALIDRKRWNLAHGRVTVSTVGLVPKIRQLTMDLPEVSLALSLHAPNQAMRAAIVPTAKHYPIQDLIDALDNHMMAYLKKRLPPPQQQQDDFTTEQRIKESTRRRAMIEYVMLEGDTSRLECAHELGKLCENRHLVVNLIPYNATDVQDKLQCPSEEHMNEFRRIVASYGTFCTIRRTMGSDISSACGQLVTTLDEQKKTKQEQDPSPVVIDIEDAAPMRGQVATTKEPPKVFLVRSKARRGAEDDDCEGALTQEVEFGLEGWIRPLSVATTVAACSFVVSSVFFLRQQKRS